MRRRRWWSRSGCGGRFSVRALRTPSKGNPALFYAFLSKEAAMENRKVRNEFGLDEYNALDVQKEPLNRAMPVILGAVAFLAVAAFVAMTSRRAS